MRTSTRAAVAIAAVGAALAAAAPAMASSALPALPAPPAAAAKAPSVLPGSFGLAAAAASSGCTRTGPTVTDFRGIRYSTRYCHNYRGGGLRLYDITSGYLYAGTNWFVCQERIGENPPVGSARNNIWLYTQGDVSYSSRYHGWGWFPATYVSGGVNYGPIPGLRWC